MIKLSTARLLKTSGLNWIPSNHDFFALPDRGMDDLVFVISDIMSFVEVRSNQPMVTFHGTNEWALDYLLTSEVIWLPTEAQLRSAIVHRLVNLDGFSLILTSTQKGNSCQINYQGKSYTFDDPEASEAYAAALLHVLIIGPGA
jgi:hypothetical protein